MEDKEEKKDYLTRIYYAARARGICHNQKEFAEAMGVNQSTISQALAGNEKYLTDRLIRNVKRWVEWSGVLTLETKEPEKKPDIVIPHETMELYTAMAKSIDRLTSLVERLQPGASAFSGVPGFAPKNSRLEK